MHHYETDGRTGNLMFRYASLYGVAKVNNKIPLVIYENFPLSEAFKLTIPILNVSYINESNFRQVYDPMTFGFSDKVFNLSCNESYEMSGLRQSFKYFDLYHEEIRKEFQFIDSVDKQCNEVLTNITRENNVSQLNCIFVGAHMRRGDLALLEKQIYGHVPASKGYLHKAVDFFEGRYSNSCKLFIVLGDDYEWNKQNSPKQQNVVVLKPQSPYVDLCILSRSNHTIISTGTFGWWAAYLAGGESTYMANQCRPDSSLCYYFNFDNYINPKWNWFGLS